jgi:hypothetical protein
MPSTMLSALDNPSPSMVKDLLSASNAASQQASSAALSSAKLSRDSDSRLPGSPRAIVEQQREFLRELNSHKGGKASPSQANAAAVFSQNGSTLPHSKPDSQKSVTASPLALAAKAAVGPAIGIMPSAAPANILQSADTTQRSKTKNRSEKRQEKGDDALDSHVARSFEHVFEVGRDAPVLEVQFSPRGRIVKVKGGDAIIARGGAASGRGRGGSAARGGGAVHPPL